MLNRKIGIGIIGCGNIGHMHAEAVTKIEDAQLVAVCDSDLARAEALSKEFGHVQSYADYQAMVQRQDLDVVCICTPSGLHLEPALAAAKAGKHILCEKPLEIDTQRIDVMIAAAEKARVLLGGVFQNRLTDTMGYVRKALADGRFGRLCLGNAYIKWYRDEDYYRKSGWRGTYKMDGGGALMNQGIHQIDLLLWLMGPVKRVCGQIANLGHDGLMETEDIGIAMLEFENGAFGTIEASTALWPGRSAEVAIYGTDGQVSVRDGGILDWEFRPELPIDEGMRALYGEEDAFGTAASDPMANLKVEGHRRQLQSFVDAVRLGFKLECDGRECRKVVNLINRIYYSAEHCCWADVG